MRKAVIRLGYSASYAGNLEDITKLAVILDRLTPVSDGYEGGHYWYVNDDDSFNIMILSQDEGILTKEAHEKRIKGE